MEKDMTTEHVCNCYGYLSSRVSLFKRCIDLIASDAGSFDQTLEHQYICC